MVINNQGVFYIKYIRSKTNKKRRKKEERKKKKKKPESSGSPLSRLRTLPSSC